LLDVVQMCLEQTGQQRRLGTLMRVEALALKLWHALRTDLVNSGGPHLHGDRRRGCSRSVRRRWTADLQCLSYAETSCQSVEDGGG
jgi:hypothetical protein